MESNMRTMLVKLSYLLKPDEVETMKYICKDIIPLKKRNEIKSSIDLFNELEQRGKLTFNDVSFVEDLLKNACYGRTDVLNVLSVYTLSCQRELETRLSHDPSNNPQSSCHSKEMSVAFICLVDNLGKEYLMVLRRLGVEDHVLDRLNDENPRNMKEVIHRALKLWHKAHCDGVLCLENVIAALKGEKRNDLAAKIACKT